MKTAAADCRVPADPDREPRTKAPGVRHRLAWRVPGHARAASHELSGLPAVTHGHSTGTSPLIGRFPHHRSSKLVIRTLSTNLRVGAAPSQEPSWFCSGWPWFCRYLRSLYPLTVRIAVICDNFSPHLTTRKDKRVGQWAAANNTEIAYTPTNASWWNRIEAQFTALRYFALDGTDHASHREQASMIRRYIIWRNNHAYDERLRRVIERANVA